MKIKTLISISIGFALLAAIVWYVDPGQLLAAMSRVSPVGLIAPILFLILAYFLRALRWKLLLSPIKNSVSIGNTFWITMVGFMVNAVIPLRLGGEFARAYVIDKRERVGFFEGLSSILVERVFDLLGITLLGVIGIFGSPSESTLPTWFSDVFKVVGVLALSLLAMIIVISRSVGKRTKMIAIIASVRFLPQKWRTKIQNAVDSVVKGCEGIAHSPTLLLQVTLLTPLVWFSFYLSQYFLFDAFGYSISPTLLLLAIMLLQLTFILPAPPGFVGTYEAYWSIIFAALTGLTNLDAALIAIGVLSHLIGNLVILILGFVGTVILGLTFRGIIGMRYGPNTNKRE